MPPPGFKTISVKADLADQLTRMVWASSAELGVKVTMSELVSCLIAGHNPDDLRGCLSGGVTIDVGSPMPGEK